MEELLTLGKTIKAKRLALNMRMDDVAKKANITRATLWSIEKGTSNCSITSLFNVLNVLDISFNISINKASVSKRDRATRANTTLDKKINRFVVMCVEQYASSINSSSSVVYKRMSEKGIINDLIGNYEDLHGMSTTYINEYISSLLGGGN